MASVPPEDEACNMKKLPISVVCYFFPSILSEKETTVGTTKLTRKEILAEDPVHGSIVMLVDYFNLHNKAIMLFVAIAVVAALGVYGGQRFLGNREMRAQEKLGRGMDYYHAQIDPAATDDPYGKGSTPVFRNETLKYQAVEKELSDIVSGYGYSKISTIARYYLGLAQLKLGKTDEAVKNLETVSNNSKDRIIGYLAKKVLAQNYVASGHKEAAREILESLIADVNYDLPKEDLRIELSRILVAEGKNEEAVKVLQEASSEGTVFGSLKQAVTSELNKVQSLPKSGQEP
jgi:predicted negative regulator of RcsB-dependent stress response